ncbi:unnamed protein product [Adineta ricciae]|uniref:RRM domain-containing protein n=1 Tax=Adineta ricciae TaxID=249248 RepID=A0A814IYS3_ADIRI|nr:unnamed protein product [Adineta ricciae]CAF1385531.1 unnamed protein product [Adineta ricciae]
MKSLVTSNIGDDRFKVFLTNLDGRINSEDLQTFFNPFGTIQYIETLSRKSAIILFSDIESIDRVLAKHRRCTINKQEIFIRRIRYGCIDRAYMDSPIVFIKPISLSLAIEWNSRTIRDCFHQYEKHIIDIRFVSNSCQAYIHFNDYDIVDQILLQTHLFDIDGIQLEIKRAKCNEKQIDQDELYIGELLKENESLKRKIKRLKIDSHEEVKHLKHKIRKLRDDLFDVEPRRNHSKRSYQ